MPFGCHPSELPYCNNTDEAVFLKNRAVKILWYYELSHRIGYALIAPISMIGFVLNICLAVFLLRLWEHKKIRWRHFPVAFTLVVMDIIGSGLMVADALVHLILVRGLYKFAGKYAALAVGAFVWAFLIPALGYAILGVLQTAAIVDPLRYTKSFHATKASIISIMYVITSLGIFALFTGIAADSVANDDEDNVLISRSVYNLAISIVVLYGLLMCIFTGCNLKITQVLWSGSHDSSDLNHEHPNPRQAHWVRFHIMFHTLVGMTFVVTHGICINYFQSMLGLLGLNNDNQSCETCFQIYEIKQRNQLVQLLAWTFRVCWSGRFIVEPFLMMHQKEVFSAASVEWRKISVRFTGEPTRKSGKAAPENELLHL